MLIILDQIRLKSNEGQWKQWVAMEISKWNLQKNKIYMKLVSILDVNSFFAC